MPSEATAAAVPYPRLRRGDRVAVVAPASPVRDDLLARGLDELRRLGLEPVVREDVRARHRFHAGDDRRRLEELRWALADPGLAAAWFARGGYGTTPLLASLDARTLRERPRLVIGESDATALGCFALAAGISWVHGPMVAGSLREGAKGFDAPSLEAALFGHADALELAPEGAACLAPGTAQGPLVGGCLTLLAATCGTPWQPRLRGAILLAEDTGVKPYQVHRSLVQLRDAGCLSGLVGVVLGDFADCVQDPEQGYAMDEVFRDFFAETAPGAPVTAGWPFGHARAPHLSLSLGENATLEAEEGGCRLVVPPRA